mmetsp:Transcript_8449/g.31265  ORF Transcript_8449/g.31265 Transcript_8449/m.31265 type:complete len:246 (-) Transcript_8449:1098-1835(-)
MQITGDSAHIVAWNMEGASIFEPHMKTQCSMNSCSSYWPLGSGGHSEFAYLLFNVHQYILQYGTQGRRFVAIGDRYYEESFILLSNSVWCCSYEERECWQDCLYLYDEKGEIVLQVQPTCCTKSVPFVLSFQFVMRILESIQKYQMRMEYERLSGGQKDSESSCSQKHHQANSWRSTKLTSQISTIQSMNSCVTMQNPGFSESGSQPTSLLSTCSVSQQQEVPFAAGVHRYPQFNSMGHPYFQNP